MALPLLKMLLTKRSVARGYVSLTTLSTFVSRSDDAVGRR
ncbi:hypothetical protein SPHV1_2280050 [Novosphingobium sp. KN65.2]|nr:hypothetical protein SPHV1_2280050 [Novosphingobium sp. KN65.2]